MAKHSQVLQLVRLGNVFTVALLRAGIKMGGFGYPMYLLTVRGRKSGQPRTVPVVLIEQNGARYVASPYGIVDWVRNVRASGEAILTRGRRVETVLVRELAPNEAGLVLRDNLKHGNPFARFFGVTAHSSLDEFERATISHPLFILEGKACGIL